MQHIPIHVAQGTTSYTLKNTAHPYACHIGYYIIYSQQCSTSICMSHRVLHHILSTIQHVDMHVTFQNTALHMHNAFHTISWATSSIVKSRHNRTFSYVNSHDINDKSLQLLVNIPDTCLSKTTAISLHWNGIIPRTWFGYGCLCIWETSLIKSCMLRLVITLVN